MCTPVGSQKSGYAASRDVMGSMLSWNWFEEKVTAAGWACQKHAYWACCSYLEGTTNFLSQQAHNITWLHSLMVGNLVLSSHENITCLHGLLPGVSTKQGSSGWEDPITSMHECQKAARALSIAPSTTWHFTSCLWSNLKVATHFIGYNLSVFLS